MALAKTRTNAMVEGAVAEAAEFPADPGGVARRRADCRARPRMNQLVPVSHEQSL